MNYVIVEASIYKNLWYHVNKQRINFDYNISKVLQSSVKACSFQVCSVKFYVVELKMLILDEGVDRFFCSFSAYAFHSHLQHQW